MAVSLSNYPSELGHELSRQTWRISADSDPLTRHMGRCIYGGIYDPDNKHGLVDANGFRTDVIDCMKDLDVPVFRYPGGNFVATYHWLDGVGPREKRPIRSELAWLGTESNQFGTDEFMSWCELVQAEPYLALNFGTGTLDEGMLCLSNMVKLRAGNAGLLFNQPLGGWNIATRVETHTMRTCAGQTGVRNHITSNTGL
jgi:hypothetical protein